MRGGIVVGTLIVAVLGAWTVFTRASPEKATQLAQITELIAQLGHERFAMRVAAGKALAEIGEPALPGLRRAAASQADLEIRRRAAAVIDVIMPSFGKSAATGMKLVRIDAGEFVMGAQARETGRRPDENAHDVRITRAFYLGMHEVTQNEYRRVMNHNPSWFAVGGGGADKVLGMEVGLFPVDSVTWYDAVEFCNRLSALDKHSPYYRLTQVQRNGATIAGAQVTILGGNGYRLPTEAEWEYACRAGTKTRFSFGDSNAGRHANLKTFIAGGYGTTSEVRELGRTGKVGLYHANPWGLHDMHGNVAEWCQDWYDKDYYGVAKLNDPAGPENGVHRVLRGGHWLISDTHGRSAARAAHLPKEDTYYTGLRVARTP